MVLATHESCAFRALPQALFCVATHEELSSDAIEEFKHAAATESIRAGLAAARKRGVRLGRPETVNAHLGDVTRLRAQGLTGRAIAKELGISGSTVFKLIKGR